MTKLANFQSLYGDGVWQSGSSVHKDTHGRTRYAADGKLWLSEEPAWTSVFTVAHHTPPFTADTAPDLECWSHRDPRVSISVDKS